MSNVYVSPTGAGDRSGSSWANAAPVTKLDAMIKKAGAGGQVLLAADKGVYKMSEPLVITGSGATIRGVNSDGSAGDAKFVGTRAADWKPGEATGNELFKLNKGANDLTFENLSIANVGNAFRAGGDLKNLTIQHVEADNVRRFFEDYASGSNKTATVSGLTIRDVDVKGFSKSVIRLQYDTNDVLIEDVRGDSERQDGDSFAMGVHLDGTVHDVTLRRVVMENAHQNAGAGEYWNGDGFATERGTYDITFEDTVARGNTDGGYDIKSSDVTMIRALAEDNAKNFRFWGKDVVLVDPVGLNPHKRGGANAQEQLWLAGGSSVKIVGGNFSDSGSITRVIENDGRLELVDTVFTVANGTKLYSGNKPVGLVESIISKVAATGSASLGAFHDIVLPVLPKEVLPVKDVVTVESPAAPTTPTAPVVPSTSPAAAVSLPPIVKDSTTPVKNAEAVEAPAAPTSPAAPAVPTNPPAPVVGLPPVTRDSTTPVKDGPTVETPAAPVEWNRIAGTKASETLFGTQGADKFVFDHSANGGADKIRGFASNDMIVFKTKLGDSNGDGLITFGRDSKLNLASGSTLVMEGVKGLRLLGEVAEGFAYGNAAAWSAGAKPPAPVALTHSKSTATSETFKATGARETFSFDVTSGGKGADTVQGFGSDDALVFKRALNDGNRDGLIAPGQNGFDLGDKKSTLKIADLGAAGLRAVGQTAEGFVYADAAVRPKGALEGKLSVADTLSGGKGDGATDRFFFDTALHRAMGEDKVVNFGAKDVVITTSRLEGGDRIAASDGVFRLVDDGVDLGGFSVAGGSGQAVGVLEFDGSRAVNGVEYFVYSGVGSAIGLDALVG